MRYLVRIFNKLENETSRIQEISKLIIILITLCIFPSINTYSQNHNFLKEPGSEDLINYEEYGTFTNIGKNNYKYKIHNPQGLAAASGEGVYPNTKTLYTNPVYQQLKQAKKLSGSPWKHVWGENPAVDFFAWSQAELPPGLKLYFAANALKEAGYYMNALKAYHAILVHYPKAYSFTTDGSFIWYIAPLAIDKIHSICILHPELGVKLIDASVTIQNSNDSDPSNDIYSIYPGKFIRVDYEKERKKNNESKPIAYRGKGEIQLVKYSNGHWQMHIKKKPFIVKGVNYSPTKIGESPHHYTLRNWQFVDDNNNGLIDAAHESWVDTNRNNIQDEDEPNVGDFQLLKNMGCNAIRIIHHSKDNTYTSKLEFNKPLLRELHAKYGIYTIIVDPLGAYTIGSGADWNEGTDYTNPEQCARMKKIVREMVLDLRDEPFVLMWVLGNENNFCAEYNGINATRTQACQNPQAYAFFLNEVAEMIHEIDPNHPVAVGNKGTDLIDYYEKYAPALDIIGINYYTDKDGFGRLWSKTQKMMDRPILITEFGCDSNDSHLKRNDNTRQKIWVKGAWEDIYYNTAHNHGHGNAIGGVVFEWLDEWWKSHKGPVFTHQRTNDCSMPFPDGMSSEEFLGIAGQGKGKHSPFLRQLKQLYFYLQDTWMTKE